MSSSYNTFDRRTGGSKFIVINDEQEDEEDLYHPQDVEPLILSVPPRSSDSKNPQRRSKVHEYQIDPLLEYGPGQVESFRERRKSQYVSNPDSLRFNNNPETPRKSLLKAKTRMSQTSMLSSSSARKTVRFAESAEGLLRSVPYDPSFNDSDFVYDMRHCIN